MSESGWLPRAGQIQTILTFFGDAFSISVTRADGVVVYVQGRREDQTLELEAIGNTHLLGDQLDPAHVATMTRLGWREPQPPFEPNFTRIAHPHDALDELAHDLATTLREVYGVDSADVWTVSPPEFGLPEGMDAWDFMDLDDERTAAPTRPGGPSVGADHSRDVPASGDRADVGTFSPYVQEQIGWYVYLLRDPRDSTVFYIGKGRGNRVFAHARAALQDLDDDAPFASLKLDRIRDIHAEGRTVRSEILRHDIPTEKQAYVVEATVIDTFRALGIPLTNAVLGHRHELHGWASTDTVASIYDAPALPETEEPILLVKISRLWTPAMSQQELYDATRGWWRVGTRAQGAKYVLAVSKGVTRAAYRIEYWRERVPGERDYSEQDRGRRLGFRGHPAPEVQHLVDRNIERIPQPSGGSVMYLNVPPAATPLVPLHRGEEARRRAAAEQHPST